MTHTPQNQEVTDLLGIKAEENLIVVYRQNAMLNIGIVVGVHKKTYSVVVIPKSPMKRFNGVTTSNPYGFLKRALDEPKGRKKIIPKEQGVFITLDQLMKSPDYYTQELEDILCRHLTLS